MSNIGLHILHLITIAYHNIETLKIKTQQSVSPVNAIIGENLKNLKSRQLKSKLYPKNLKFEN